VELCQKAAPRIRTPQQVKTKPHTKDDNAKNEEQTKDAFKLNPELTAQTQPYQLTYIDDTVTVLPLTVQNQHFIGPMSDGIDHTMQKTPNHHITNGST
jgi:hypothetical protein